MNGSVDGVFIRKGFIAGRQRSLAGFRDDMEALQDLIKIGLLVKYKMMLGVVSSYAHL